MIEQTAEQFIAALGEVESGGDLEPMVALYAEGCEVGNVTMSHHEQGVEGAHTFWKNYQATLGKARSVFRNRIYGENRAALEWETEGHNQHDKPIRYEGVSILETDGDKITRFYAYFDPHKLGQQIAES